MALSAINQQLFDAYYKAAISGGCDVQQAQSIASERTLADIMGASAQIAAVRERLSGNVVRDEPAPRY